MGVFFQLFHVPLAYDSTILRLQNASPSTFSTAYNNNRNHIKNICNEPFERTHTINHHLQNCLRTLFVHTSNFFSFFHFCFTFFSIILKVRDWRPWTDSAFWWKMKKGREKVCCFLSVFGWGVKSNYSKIIH